MKKPLIAAAVVAVITAVLLMVLWPRKTREQRVCEKLVSLCGIDKVAPPTCTEGLTKAKQQLGAEALTAAEDCVLEAKSCGVAAGCLAQRGLAALPDFLGGLLHRSKGAAKALGKRLLDELEQRAGGLGDQAKKVVGELTSKVSGQLAHSKQQVAGAIEGAGRTLDRGQDVVAGAAAGAKEKLTAAQRELRGKIAAQLAAAEAKVKASHAKARQWVSDAARRVGQQAKDVKDSVARYVRRGLGAIRGGKDAGAPDATEPAGDAAVGDAAKAAEADPVARLERQLARAKELIASERHAEARELLDQLSWSGKLTGDSERDKQLVAYYRARRQALIGVLDRFEGKPR